MPISTIGDMSQHFQSLRNTGSIKIQLARLSQEMSSGQVADLGTHLKGNTTALTGLNHEIAMLDEYSSSNSETSRILDMMQITLQRMDTQRENAANSFLSVNAETNSHQVENAAATAKSAFSEIISGLNSTIGGRSLFAGTAVDVAPLAEPDSILVDLVASISGATSKADIVSAIDSWFDTAGGGFDTVAYSGNQDNQARATDGQNNVSLDVRGDDPSVRELLKGFAYAAVVSDISMSVTDRVAAELVNEAGVKLIEAAEGFSYLQGRLGGAQEAVTLAEASNSTQRASFEIARSDMVRADPFETATKLQDIQTQLETHFAVTARLSRLNLVDFLR